MHCALNGRPGKSRWLNFSRYFRNNKFFLSSFLLFYVLFFHDRAQIEGVENEGFAFVRQLKHFCFKIFLLFLVLTDKTLYLKLNSIVIFHFLFFRGSSYKSFYNSIKMNYSIRHSFFITLIKFCRLSSSTEMRRTFWFIKMGLKSLKFNPEWTKNTITRESLTSLMKSLDNRYSFTRIWGFLKRDDSRDIKQIVQYSRCEAMKVSWFLDSPQSDTPSKRRLLLLYHHLIMLLRVEYLPKADLTQEMERIPSECVMGKVSSELSQWNIVSWHLL